MQYWTQILTQFQNKTQIKTSFFYLFLKQAHSKSASNKPWNSQNPPEAKQHLHYHNKTWKFVCPQSNNPPHPVLSYPVFVEDVPVNIWIWQIVGTGQAGEFTALQGPGDQLENFSFRPTVQREEKRPVTRQNCYNFSETIIGIVRASLTAEAITALSMLFIWRHMSWIFILSWDFKFYWRVKLQRHLGPSCKITVLFLDVFRKCTLI